MDGTVELGALITLVITNIVSPYITWLLAKKKYYAEVDSNQIRNMQESLNFYKDFCDNTRQQLAAMQAEHAAYKEASEKEAKRMRDEIRDMRSQQMVMYQLICMDLPCKSRQPFLEEGMSRKDLKEKLDMLHSFNEEEKEEKEEKEEDKE